MLKLQKQIPSGTIVLDRPAKRNALSRQMVGQLTSAFSDFHQEKSVRAVILTGSGESFCSGMDLAEWYDVSQQQEPLEQWQEIAEELRELIEVMLRFPKPIIAAIDGPVIGMGMALALASDLIVSSARSSFALPAPAHGLISGLVAPLLVFRAGGAIAAKMLVAGEPMDAAEAHRLALIHKIVPSEQIWVQSHAIAEHIAMGAAESMQMTKRLLNEMVGESLLSQLFSGAAAMAAACSTAAAEEGLAAFVEKRSPKFP